MEVKVAYALELNQEHVANCDIQITVQSKKSGTFTLQCIKRLKKTQTKKDVRKM